MANKDLLKEAIADARLVKETAIANAKAALEEAFAPHIKELLSEKVKEMENEMDENYDEAMGSEAELEESMDEEYMDEEDMYDENMDEELDLEALLKELDEEGEEPMYEAKKANASEKEEKAMKSEKKEKANASEKMEKAHSSKKEDKEVSIEDMSEEDLKSFIETVIQDMIDAGEIEGASEEMGGFEEKGSEEAPEMEMNPETPETGIEEDVNLDELLMEIEMEEMLDEMEMDEDYMDEEELDEAGSLSKTIKAKDSDSEGYFEKYDRTSASRKLGNAEKIKTKFKDEDSTGYYEKFDKSSAAQKLRRVKDLDPEFKNKKAIDRKSKAYFELDEMANSSENRQEELNEAYNTIKTLRSELNEINLLNAKLLYTNKLFKAKNLTETQKLKVLSSFDKAATVSEVKLVYETLNEGIKETKKSSPINESVNFASKSIAAPKKQPILETDEIKARFQKLAGII
jgi:hypothetical protein